MIKLAISDLKYNVSAWLGLLIIAILGGILGEFAASILSTGAQNIDSTAKMLNNAGIMVIVFSSTAAIPVLILASRLFVAEKEKVYALWRLNYASSTQMRLVILSQLFIIAIIGALIGSLCMASAFKYFYPIFFSTRETLRNIPPEIAIQSIPVICLIVLGLFLIGSIPGLHKATRISPLIALKDTLQGTKSRRKNILLSILITLCLLSLFLVMKVSEFELSSMIALLVPIIVTILFALMSYILLPGILKIWTQPFLFFKGIIFPITRSRALYNMNSSTAIESSIMVLIALLTSMYTALKILESVSLSTNQAQGSGFELDLTLAMLMFSGPVLLGVAGATLTTIISSRSKSNESSRLLLIGLLRHEIILCVALEAAMHSITAFICGLLCCLVSSSLIYFGINATALVIPQMQSGIIIAVIGFILVGFSMLIPSLASFNSSFLRKT